MKKNYSFYLTLVMIPICAALFISFSGGQNVYYVSGSPSDIAEHSPQPGDCTQCHNDSPVISNSGTVILTVPSDYALSTTYSISVASSSENPRQGFQLSAEDPSGNKVGDFTDDGANNQAFNSPIPGSDRGEAITHTAAGAYASPHTWTFDWTSPATDVGPITFYAAVNESNEDFNSTGDRIHLKQSLSNVLSTENFVFNDLKLYPNPNADYFNIELPSELQNKTTIAVFDLTGKRIHNQPLNDLKTEVNVSNWKSGVYLVRLSSDTANITKRFVKS